eukprot:TRINITY_DN19795_c0_g1_i1.p1 TRINITY_DN19795_c0_g1~~TRINITY_DN19795_c0_g1_i1.p1  ORF type:complete len:381 (-),score=13.96 TRINITY_DN19795_c0_g1_i1:140-1282(-)
MASTYERCKKVEIASRDSEMGDDRGFRAESRRWLNESEKLVSMCRRASSIHKDLLLQPTAIVTSRIKPHLIDYYEKHNNLVRQRIFLFLCLLGVVTLPWMYAHTLMPYPCTARASKIKGFRDYPTVHVHLEESDCPVEDQMRSQDALWYGGFLVTLSFALMFIISVATELLNCAYNRFGYTWISEVRRYLWRPLLLLWAVWIDRHMPRLKYVNEHNIICGLYTRPSVLFCWLYLTLIIDMVFIGFHSGAPSIGLLTAYGMSKVFLIAGNYLIGASDNSMMLTQGQIKNWLPPGRPAGTTTVLTKLVELRESRNVLCSLTTDDLEALEGFDGKRPATVKGDTLNEDDSTVEAIGVFSKVYITDVDIMVDLVSGTTEILHKG